MINTSSSISPTGNFAEMFTITYDLGWFAIAVGIVGLITALIGVAATIRQNIFMLKFVGFFIFCSEINFLTIHLVLLKKIKVSIHTDLDHDVEYCGRCDISNILWQNNEHCGEQDGNHVYHQVPR